MTATIVDSSALVALALTTDAFHEKARAISEYLKQNGTIVLVPVEVLSETLNILGKLQGREYAVTFGQQLLTDSAIHPMNVSEEGMRIALGKWQKQGGGVSYTDCLVMARADESETTTIFGFDAVFEKNGYVLPNDEGETA